MPPENEPAVPAAPLVTPKDAIPWAVDAWKTTVSVQQHFNDLELRIRNFAITFTTAVLGLAGLALKELSSSPLPVALLFIGALGWGAFYFMDRFWYHRFLDAAGEHAGKIERWLAAATGTEQSVFNLSGGIKSRSAMPPKAGWGFVRRILKAIYGEETLRSRGRIDLFYGGFLVIYAILGTAFYWQAGRAARPEQPIQVVLKTDGSPATGLVNPPVPPSGLPPTQQYPQMPAATPPTRTKDAPPNDAAVKKQTRKKAKRDSTAPDGSPQ